MLYKGFGICRERGVCFYRAFFCDMCLDTL
jgi:hypothetical protein